MALSINAEQYQSIIHDFIANLEADECYCWLQQDGATAHTSKDTMAFLSSFFNDRLIARDYWPARSLDLSPYDFFLWGCMKDRIFVTNPTSIEDLKATITTLIHFIDVHTLRKVFQNMMKRAKACLSVEGGHFEHLL